jgi:NAD(P)-dependent dehydrogenase (short-subunit alcohol dehydrogenase family)
VEQPKQLLAERLQGRVALVTGGASGIGLAIARRLAAEGADVAISDVDEEQGRSVSSNTGLPFLKHDVRDPQQWSRVIQDVETEHGALHILINNAGILGDTTRANPEATSLEDWRALFAVNVEGVLLGCQAAIASMRRTGFGAIVNISSVAGLVATPYATAYGASKATVRHITKSVAQHCAEQGLRIRCNSVHPGDVRTPLWDTATQRAAAQRGVSFDEAVKEAEATIPSGEMISEDDVAAAVAFLVSDDARHITGAKMLVDGGLIGCDSFHMTKHLRARRV